MGDFDFDVKSLDSYNKIETNYKNTNTKNFNNKNNNTNTMNNVNMNANNANNVNANNVNNDEESDIKSLSQEDLIRFKELANKFFSLNEDIQKIEEVLRERKKLKADLTKKILSFMAEYDIEDLNTNKGKLVYSVSKRKSGLSIAGLKKNINNFFKNEDQSNQFLKFLDEREIKEIVSLKVMK